MKYSGIGGQAVIEGIMMMKGEDYAVAVRRPDKEIEVKKDTYQSITKKAKILQLPFVRGVFRFADSMIIGMRSLKTAAPEGTAYKNKNHQTYRINEFWCAIRALLSRSAP